MLQFDGGRGGQYDVLSFIINIDIVLDQCQTLCYEHLTQYQERLLSQDNIKYCLEDLPGEDFENKSLIQYQTLCEG